MNTDPVDTSSELRSEVAALRNQLFTLLVALIVVSGTITLYLFRVASVAGKQNDVFRGQLGIYQKNDPALVDFVTQLGAFGMTHSDIRPILAKYRIAVAPSQPQPAAPAK